MAKLTNGLALNGCWAFVLGSGLLVLGCEDKPKDAPKSKAEAQKSAAPAPSTPPPAPTGPLSVEVQLGGIKVGGNFVPSKDGFAKDKIGKLITEAKDQLEGKDIDLKIDRSAPMRDALLLTSELSRIGVAKIRLTSPKTRTGYPEQIELTPQSKIGKPENCSVVLSVLKDRSTAVWKLAPAEKALSMPKGMAGPDLSNTADYIERKAKACPKSKVLFFTADETVEFGNAYDLAASALVLKSAKFEQVVLLDEVAPAGREVKLGK